VTGISVSTRHGEIVPISDDTFESLGLADLRRLRFTGKARPGQSFSGNFVECLFESVELENINFARCDWKDCYVYDTTFLDCNLGSASLITNSFESCRFVHCRFPDTGISDSNFRDCSFERCDFTNVVMKSNRVERTLFSKCKTSNRIIESSLLIDTRWTEMLLEVGLLLGNFGLRKADVENCTFYRKTGNRESKALDLSDVEIENGPQLSPIERFRLAFFRTGTADGDADALENALNPRSWTGDAIIESSFGALLTNFSQFLLALYSADRLPTYVILRLHTHNFELLEWLAGKGELLSLYQVAAGVHLTLTREVDSFASLLQVTADAFDQTRLIHIEANGPLEKAFYEELFEEVGLKGVRIKSVRPRSSPVELIISFLDYSTLMALGAIVLASRTKFELTKIPRSDWKKLARAAVTQKPSPKSRELITFQSGFSSERPSEFQINVRTLLPRSLLLDLHLSFSVAVFKKVRSVLINLLQPKGPENPK
jgi:uncharacterized protein YjbI with pentapeptide repeats